MSDIDLGTASLYFDPDGSSYLVGEKVSTNWPKYKQFTFYLHVSAANPNGVKVYKRKPSDYKLKLGEYVFKLVLRVPQTWQETLELVLPSPEYEVTQILQGKS